MNKKLLILLIVSLAAAAVAVVYFVLLNRATVTTDRENANKPYAIEKKDLSATQLPVGFEKSFPMEPGAEIKQNYQATTTDGRTQSTRIVTTNKTVVEAVNFYKAYYVNLGWTITGNATDTTKVLLRKNDDTVQLIGQTNETTKEKSVEITLTELAQQR